MRPTPCTQRIVVRDDDIAALVDALTRCDQAELTAALYNAGEAAIVTIAAATHDAALHAAHYPRDEVIAEADALLYDVLRWPITDIDPNFPASVDIHAFARHRGIATSKAQRIVDSLVATERDAADALLASGVWAMYTRGQAQAFRAIENLVAQGITPTRARVREQATTVARNGLRPDQGPDPVVYSSDPSLPARAISSHPTVDAVLWLDRMDANPPQPAALDERIEHLATAQSAAGSNSKAAEQTRTAEALLVIELQQPRTAADTRIIASGGWGASA